MTLVLYPNVKFRFNGSDNNSINNGASTAIGNGGIDADQVTEIYAKVVSELLSLNAEEYFLEWLEDVTDLCDL